MLQEFAEVGVADVRYQLPNAPVAESGTTIKVFSRECGDGVIETLQLPDYAARNDVKVKPQPCQWSAKQRRERCLVRRA